MSIGNKLRFEVFKRDDFTCKYCGRKSPDIVLELEHIIPKSKGGTDEIINLNTACFECNRGKGANLISSVSRDDIDEIIAEKLLKEIKLKEYYKIANRQENRIKREFTEVQSYWSEIFNLGRSWVFLETLRPRIKNYLKKSNKHLVMEAMNIARLRFPESDGDMDAFKYFCGCAKKLIDGVENE